MEFKINNKIKYNNIHIYSYILNKSTLINLINENKQFGYCEKNLLKNNKFFKLAVLFFIVSIKLIKKNFNNIYFNITKSNKNNSFINILNKFEFFSNLKLKFFNLSIFKQKLIFYTVAKFIELIIYGILIKIMVSPKYINKILCVRPFILQ